MPPGFAQRPAAGRIGDGGEEGQDNEGLPGTLLDEEALYRRWRDATEASIGADLRHIRTLMEQAHPAHLPLLDYWMAALEQLEHWLRDR